MSDGKFESLGFVIAPFKVSMGKKSKRRNPTSSKNTNISKIGQKKSSSTINGGVASGDKNNDDGINKWTIHDKKLAGSPNRRRGGG